MWVLISYIKGVFYERAVVTCALFLEKKQRPVSVQQQRREPSEGREAENRPAEESAQGRDVLSPCLRLNGTPTLKSVSLQLEKCLKTQIDTWEQEHEKEFQVNGQKFLEYVQQQWDQHHTEKEKEKLERVSERLHRADLPVR